MNCDEDAWICIESIGDEVLREILRGEAEGPDRICDHCGEERACIKLGKLADIVDERYRELFESGKDMPVFDRESDKPHYEQIGDSPANVIEALTGVDYDICEDLEAILSEREEIDVRDGEESYYDSGSRYELRDMEPWELRYSWRGFCYRIKHERRFFDDLGRITLDQIFAALETAERAEHVSPVVVLEPGGDLSRLFRGRIAQSEEQAEEIAQDAACELGPPPPDLTPAGRMNAVGVPIFYGAFSRETCVAEVRPSVGGFVVTGEFGVVQTLRLLDLSVFETLPPGGSLFRARMYEEVSGWLFMRELERTLSQPVQPHEEAIEYVPTQAVAEYVANILNFDGLIYSPAQRALQWKEEERDLARVKNVALFRGDGIVELAEPESTEEPACGLFGIPVNFDDGPRRERREPALRFVGGSPECVRIKGFEIESERVYLRLKGEEPEF